MANINRIKVTLVEQGKTGKWLAEQVNRLGHAADQMRAGAHLAPNKYGQPILGLIIDF